MKLLLEPIEVERRGSVPQHVVWRHQHYDVLRVEERWLWHGRWWTTPNLSGESRRYFKIAVASAAGDPLTMEVYREGSGWVLSQLED
jgi:hypothetical protein